MKKIMKTGVYFLASGLLAVILSSCQQRPYLEEYLPLPSDNWNRFQTLWFDYTPANNKQPMQVELIIRYTEVLTADRVEIMATIHSPSGNERFREYNYITRDREGRITGKANAEPGQPPSWYEGTILLRRDFVFDEEGTYRFEIENLMGKFDNRGIKEIGLRITRAPAGKKE